MKVTLEAIKETGIKTVIIHPNSDSGSHGLVRAIKEYESVSHINVQKNIPRLEFVNLMRNANCLVGNSSSGILEAPYLKLPAVNIGSRQSGRIHAENVQFVPHDKDSIISAVKRALFDKEYRAQVAACNNPFGDGLSSKQIAHALASVDINKRLLVKDNTF
jgi:GDP/UDP-N,N'-diacetylbacillosamine 2-epimerase (hydrolysing)